MSPSKFSSLSILFSSLFLLLASTVSAHNITRILDRHPDFSTFNQLLTKTHLAGEINRRKTITVLAVPSDGIGDLTSRPVDTARAILMNHVVLDYYDVLKLQNLKRKSAILTTLYQTTGSAAHQQGFLNVTEDKRTGKIVFGSAVKGAQQNVDYLDTVASQPYNISVLSVSHLIIAPGIDGQPLRPIAAPPKSNAPAPKLAPAPAEAPEAEVPVEAQAEAPAADSPAPSADSEAPTDAPASAPSDEGPAADDASDQAESPRSSAVKHLASRSSLAFLVVLGSFLLAH